VYPHYKLKCPRCHRDVEIVLTPDIIKQAAESRDGLARIAITHEDHVVVVQVDRYGTIRNATVGLMIEATEDCEVVKGVVPKVIERQLENIAKRGGPQNDSERVLWDYAKEAGYVVCR